MPSAVATNAVTRITFSFLLSLMSGNRFTVPEVPVNSKYHWAYKGSEGPASWKQHYRYCAGERQSPINIITASTVYDNTLGPIVLENFDRPSGTTGPFTMNVTNNGHTAKVGVLSEDMRVYGGGLSERYKTVEFHFHWGSNVNIGSEHAVNGRKYPLEMHVVNFAEKYGNSKLAMTKPDGFAVLGVFFELSDKDNPTFAVLDEALRHVRKAGEITTISNLHLRDLLPQDMSRYWRYNGSLTTPACFETVTWTVFAEVQNISMSQLETLRSLLLGKKHNLSDRGQNLSFITSSRLVDNWRPIQPLNGRVVKRSFNDNIDGLAIRKTILWDKITTHDVSKTSTINDTVSIVGVNLESNSQPALSLGHTTEPTGRTTEPTDRTTESTGRTTEPTDRTTESTGRTTEPTDRTTESTGRTTEPTGRTTVPTGRTTVPTGRTTVPTGRTTEPTGRTTEPTGRTTELIGRKTESTGRTTALINRKTESTGRTTEQTSRTTEPTSRTTEPTSRTTEPTGRTTEPTSRITGSTGRTTEPTSRTTEPTGRTTEPTSRTTESTGRTTEPTSRTTEPTSRTTEPTGHTTEPTSRTTEPTGHTTEPTSSTTEPTGHTTEPIVETSSQLSPINKFNVYQEIVPFLVHGSESSCFNSTTSISESLYRSDSQTVPPPTNRSTTTI